MKRALTITFILAALYGCGNGDSSTQAKKPTAQPAPSPTTPTSDSLAAQLNDKEFKSKLKTLSQGGVSADKVNAVNSLAVGGIKIKQKAPALLSSSK